MAQPGRLAQSVRQKIDKMVRRIVERFDPGVFLLTKARAIALKSGTPREREIEAPVEPQRQRPTDDEIKKPGETGAQTKTFRLSGTIPPEIWNRLGTKLLPKLRSGQDLTVGVEFSVTVDAGVASSLENDLRQALEDLGITGQVRIAVSS